MKRLFVICMILSVFACSSGLALAKMKVPGRTASRVNDYAGIVDEETEEYLENLINSIEQKTPDPIEVIVATFNSIEGWEFSDFAGEYGEKWREVKKGRRDNGVILLVVLDRQQLAIGPGQNLKDILPEAKVNDIMQDVIVPEFKKGDYAEGIKKGTEAIVKVLREADIPMDGPAVMPKVMLITALIILALFLARFIKALTKKAYML